MAQLKGDFSFIGSLGNVSAYKMRGCEHVVLRTKGGASRDKIRSLPSFARTRELNKEWGACAKAGAAVRRAISPVKHMADYNISGPLNALAKTIQKLDTIHPRGSRAIYFTKYKELLAGFSLNNANTLDSIVRRPITYTINRETGSAAISLPELIPGINFNNLFKNPFFRFVVALGNISDVEYKDDIKDFQPVNTQQKQCASVVTDWHSSFVPFAGQTIDLMINNGQRPEDCDTLILSAGIEFGNPMSGNEVVQIKYSGSAKIIATT
jgi:hypothetical protein